MDSATISAVTFLPDGKQLALASDDQTLRFWDTTSALKLQKKKLVAPVSSLKLSTGGDWPTLQTVRGTLDLPDCFLNRQRSDQGLSGNVFFAGEWIYRGDQWLLWLPCEYRGQCWAVRDDLVVIGQKSGQLPS